MSNRNTSQRWSRDQSATPSRSYNQSGYRHATPSRPQIIPKPIPKFEDEFPSLLPTTEVKPVVVAGWSNTVKTMETTKQQQEAREAETKRLQKLKDAQLKEQNKMNIIKHKSIQGHTHLFTHQSSYPVNPIYESDEDEIYEDNYQDNSNYQSESDENNY